MNAEALFIDEIRLKRQLCKNYGKPKARIGKGWIKNMTPDELIKEAAEHGITISRAQLNNYRKMGIISQPKTGSYGRGLGRYTDYPEQALSEIAAAKLCKGSSMRLRLDEIAEARKTWLDGEEKTRSRSWAMFKEVFEDTKSLDKAAEIEDVRTWSRYKHIPIMRKAAGEMSLLAEAMRNPENIERWKRELLDEKQ